MPVANCHDDHSCFTKVSMKLIYEEIEEISILYTWKGGQESSALCRTWEFQEVMEC